jgi:hypothetical protein
MRRYFQKIPCYQARDQFAHDCAHHHPVSANRTFPIRRQIGPFRGDFRPLTSRILVSAGVYAFRWRFLAPCLRIQKFRSRRPALSVKSDCTSPRKSAFCVAVIRDLWLRSSHSGLRPSASNCRLHSLGGSRSRSMLMPRGRRPSTAALTTLGARKASEMVILTCRTLHFSRAQS